MNLGAIMLYMLYNVIYNFLPFAVQIAAGEVMFAFRLKRKKHFPVRLAISLAIFIVCLFAVTYLSMFVSYFLWGTLAYITIFALTVAVMKACFDETVRTLLFCGVAAYAMQNLSYRVLSIVQITGGIMFFANRIGFTAAYNLFNYGLFVLIGIVGYFLFARRMNEKDAAHLHGANVFAVSGLMLIVTVFLCAWTNMYYDHFYLLLINYLFSILCCILILILQSGMLHNVGLERDLEIVNQMWLQDKKQYEISKENIEIINIKCHDLKYKVKMLRLAEGEVSKEELQEIENAIAIYDAKIKTGCAPLDVILTEKSFYCYNNGITLSVAGNGEKLSAMSANDVYSLFGNILSNAIEAVLNIEDASKRVINFSIQEIGDMLFIREENYCADELVFKDGLPQSGKADKINHGYGVKSIKMIVAKYGGELTLSADGETFILKIMFPVPKKT